MSKGNKAICMRLPPPLLERMEAEAAAQGITVPELCRRKIVEGSPSVDRERATAQVTPIPTPLTSVVPNGSPWIGTPAPSPVGPSQKVEEAIAAGTAAEVLANIQAKFPELSPPTETMMRTWEKLAKLAKEHPEAIGEFLAKERAKGEMSDREIAEFLKSLGL